MPLNEMLNEALNEEQRARISAFGLDEKQVERLRERARREVAEGLLPGAQFALARGGEIVISEEYGQAEKDSLICIFSATKALTSTAAWLLIEDGRLDVSEPVQKWVPEFAENGKETVKIEQLFTHTAGFPTAPLNPLVWDDPQQRREKFKRWRLNWPAGSRFEYHPSSSMYVVADIIERITGQDWRLFAKEKILAPLGCEHSFYIGLPEKENSRALACEYVSQAATEEDYQTAGLPLPVTSAELAEGAILGFNSPNIRAVGMPAGGGFATAGALALFYQALLRDGGLASHEPRQFPRVWQASTVAMGLQVRTSDSLVDPLYKKPASRALGLIIAGDEARSFRGFGHQNSAQAFGHGGMGGQIAWADPETGISFAYCTNGHDRNAIRQGRRTVSLCNAAARCASA